MRYTFDTEQLALFHALMNAPDRPGIEGCADLVNRIAKASRAYHRHAEACCNGDYYRGVTGEIGERREETRERSARKRAEKVCAELVKAGMHKSMSLEFKGDPRAGYGFEIVFPEVRNGDSPLTFRP